MCHQHIQNVIMSMIACFQYAVVAKIVLQVWISSSRQQCSNSPHVPFVACQHQCCSSIIVRTVYCKTLLKHGSKLRRISLASSIPDVEQNGFLRCPCSSFTILPLKYMGEQIQVAGLPSSSIVILSAVTVFPTVVKIDACYM